MQSETVLIPFEHKTFEERMAEYGGRISIASFDWDEPVGREDEQLLVSDSGFVGRMLFF